MDLELLLADLSSQFDARRREEIDALSAELTDAERVSITLASRMRASRGRELTVLVRGGMRLRGRVLDAAREWVLLRRGRGDDLVPLSAVVAVWPLGGVGAEEERVGGRVRIGHALRELSDQGVPLVVDHDAGVHHGVIVAVFADHFDLESVPDGRGGDSRDLVGSVRMTLSLGGVRRIAVWGGREVSP